MCGRASQSVRGVERSAELLGASPPPPPSSSSSSSSSFDNPNLSPGMRSLVFRHRDGKVDGGVGEGTDDRGMIACEESVWGLIVRGGTSGTPLPPGPSKHFADLRFNARADTLYDRRTFRDLAGRGRTCVVAVDGFYEWGEADPAEVGGGGGGGPRRQRQPYYVRRADGAPMWIAGLWTSVPTGRKGGGGGSGSEPPGRNGGGEGGSGRGSAPEEMLDTFALLTTEACPELRWLHHRQPVVLGDVRSALRWMRDPSREAVRELADRASRGSGAGGGSGSGSGRGSGKGAKEANAAADYYAPPSLAWHPVTRRMSRVQYRGADSVDPIRIERIPSVRALFARAATSRSAEEGGGGEKGKAKAAAAAAAAEEEEAGPPGPKRMGSVLASSPRSWGASSSPKKARTSSPASPPRRGQITSFFAARPAPGREKGKGASMSAGAITGPEEVKSVSASLALGGRTWEDAVQEQVAILEEIRRANAGGREKP